MRLRELLREGRRVLQLRGIETEWVNKVTARDPVGDYNLYTTTFDDPDKTVSGGRWVRKFNRNILVTPDGKMVGLPKKFQGQRDPTALSRVLFRREADRSVKALANAITGLRYNVSSWNRVTTPDDIKERVNLNADLKATFEKKFGEDWEKRLPEAAFSSALEETYSAYSIAALIKAHVNTQQEADNVGAMIEASPSLTKRCIESFGLGYKKSIDVLLKGAVNRKAMTARKNPWSSEEEDVDAGSAQVLKTLSRYYDPSTARRTGASPDIRILRKLAREVGGTETLATIGARTRAVRNAMEALFEPGQGKNWVSWQDRLRRDDAEQIIKSLKKGTGIERKDYYGGTQVEHWFSARYSSATRKELSKRVEAFTSPDELARTLESNPKLQKKFMGVFQKPGMPECTFEQVKSAMQTGTALRDATVSGQNLLKAHADDWRKEATFKERLTDQDYRAVMQEERARLDKLFRTAASPEEACSSLREKLMGRAGSSSPPHRIEIGSEISGERRAVVERTLSSLEKLIPRNGWGPPVDKRKVVTGFSPKMASDPLRITGAASRGFFSIYLQRIDIHPSGDEESTETVLYHEMGHYLEHANGKISDAIEYFMRARTSDEMPSSLQEKSAGYGVDEISQPDDFFDVYVGKLYGNFRSSEVLSMGLQEFRNPDKMKALWEKDPEHFALIMAILQGKFGFRE